MTFSKMKERKDGFSPKCWAFFFFFAGAVSRIFMQNVGERLLAIEKKILLLVTRQDELWKFAATIKVRLGKKGVQVKNQGKEDRTDLSACPLLRFKLNSFPQFYK